MSVNPKTRRRLALLFSIPLAFSLVFFLVNQAAEHRETKLLEVQQLSNTLGLVRATTRDAESGERGYLLTHEDRYLIPLNQANETVERHLRLSIEQAENRPRFKPAVVEMAAQVRATVSAINSTLAQERSGSLSPAMLSQRLSQSEDLMIDVRGKIRNLLAALTKEELSILESQQNFSRWSFAFFASGSLLMIGIIVWLYNVLLRYLEERDAANANLQIANAHLEGRIEERTKDLQLANQELQQFAYVASHDLQEPLRTITSFSQLLVLRYGSRFDADADEFIGYIVTAAKRMTDLINGLLALVRLRKAGQPTEPVSFNGLVSEAEAGLQASIRESGAVIECAPLPSLVVDTVQFSQVIQNLLSNAIKYRREQSPKITIKAERNSSHWILSFTDNGRGFDPQFAERIFGLFQRLQNREVEGTGMGLSIARKIVERHGGRMWAESQPGVGSTFFVSLPVTLEDSKMRTEETVSR